MEGFRAKDDFIIRRIYVNNITLEDAEGEQFLLPESYLDVKINLKKKTPVPSEEKLLIFPNPAKDALNIHFNGRNTIQALKLFDSMGNMIDSRNDINAQSHTLNTETLPTGIYVIRLVTTEGVISKKIQILRK